MEISYEREQAIATFPADLQTVGDHIVQTVEVTSTWLAKPSGATHCKVQALVQNVRYRIDENMATTAIGFQLQAGADTLIPCPNRGLSFAAEVAGAIIQAQFVR